MKIPRIALALLALITILVLGACAAPAQSPAAAPATTGAESSEATTEEATSEDDRFGGTMRLGYQSDIQRPNYLVTLDGPSGLLRDLTWEKLWGVSSDGTVIPRLATGLEVSEDGLEYTVTLREGVTWHDGVAFSADDVVFYWDYYKRLIESGGSVDAVLPQAVEVEKIDDYTVKFILEQPNPFFQYTFGGYMVLPKHIWENVDPATWDQVADWDLISVGIGPFHIVERSVGEYFQLERYDGYWDGRPYLDGVVLQIITDTDARNAAFESGQLDFLGNLNKTTYELLQGVDGVNLTLMPSGNMALLLLNQDDPRIADISVRTALSLIANREALSIANPNVSSPMKSVVTSADLYFNPDVVESEAFEFSIEKANAVLDEAGWVLGSDGVREKDGERLEFEVISWRPDGEPMIVVLADAAKQAGIALNLRQIDLSLFVERVFTDETRDFSVAYNGMTMGPVPSGYRLMYSEGTYTTYVNEELQQVFADLFAAKTDEERQALFDKVQEVVSADRAATWLVEGTRVIGSRNGLVLDESGVSGLYQQWTNVGKLYFAD